MDFPDHVTMRDKYTPAMGLETPEAAAAYLERCVAHHVRMRPSTSCADAREIERRNLGYFAGYFDHTVRVRVERLFECTHPHLGKAIPGQPPTSEQCLEAGLQAGRQWAQAHRRHLPDPNDLTELDLAGLDATARALEEVM